MIIEKILSGEITTKEDLIEETLISREYSIEIKLFIIKNLLGIY